MGCTPHQGTGLLAQKLTPEDIEGLNFQNLAHPDIVGDSGNDQHHYEGQSEIPIDDHGRIVRHPKLSWPFLDSA